MKKYTEEIKTVKVLSKIECDKCGTVYTEPYDMDEFLCLDFPGGYYSVFGDLVQVQADICQKCLKKMIQTFCRVQDIDF